MSSYIEKRRNKWYATLKVPARLQGKIGLTKLLKSLQTPDKRTAEARARPIVSLWQAKLREADGEAGSVHQELLQWREAYAEAEATDDEGGALGAITDALLDKAEAIAQAHDEQAAQKFYAVATGKKTPTSLHFVEWKAHITNLKQKTQDQYAKDVQLLVDKFHVLEDITPKEARKWVTERQGAGDTYSSLKRMVSAWRRYWKYLESIDAVPPNSFPFSVQNIQRAKKTKKGGWIKFPAESVPALWLAAEEGKDGVLADLIRIGAYSGARIEELCSLKVDDVTPVSFLIVDAKTEAGIREVPIHKAIAPLMDRLKAQSEDGYILSGLTFNKYGDRSNAIGKRFGRLKTRLGYGEAHVFHSLRKTLVTLLEDAGVPENLAADIVGHEKPSMTYGLYSGGASLETKAEALARAHYPGT